MLEELNIINYRVNITYNAQFNFPLLDIPCKYPNTPHTFLFWSLISSRIVVLDLPNPYH